MQINELKVTVGEVCEGYFNDAEEGVLLQREYEYLTSPRLDLSADLRLTRRFGSRGLRGYVAAGYAWEQAFGTQYLGNAMRHAALLRVGCEF